MTCYPGRTGFVTFTTGTVRRRWSWCGSGAAKQFGEPQLLAIVCQVALINAVNRVNVMTRRPGGDYQPGHLPI
jgi:alkylhydroperoxidase family enzyme